MPLEGRTLAEVLNHLTIDFHENEYLDIQFETTGGSRPLPARIEIGLYRIAQEAPANTAQHANAYHVTVELIITPEHAHLDIEDAGQGFNPDYIPDNHYGLIGLNERVKLLNGSLHIDSSQETGTRIDVKVPLIAGSP